MKLSHTSASQTFNQVFESHDVGLSSTSRDLWVGKNTVLTRTTELGLSLADSLFDFLAPSAQSGVYYNYLSPQALRAVIDSKKLRFFSTKKLSSDGEFVPFCKTLGLDGYYREDDFGNRQGISEILMDDIFYKSFVSDPDSNSEEFWNTFAAKGTGARLEVHIDVSDDFSNLRKVSYLNSKELAVFHDLLNAFRSVGTNFTPHGMSRIPAYFQLNEFSHHDEIRLIAKRLKPPGVFPYEVFRDEEQDCNYIDCSLTEPERKFFKLELRNILPGPNSSQNDRQLISSFTETLNPSHLITA